MSIKKGLRTALCILLLTTITACGGGGGKGNTTTVQTDQPYTGYISSGIPYYNQQYFSLDSAVELVVPAHTQLSPEQILIEKSAYVKYFFKNKEGMSSSPEYDDNLQGWTFIVHYYNSNDEIILDGETALTDRAWVSPVKMTFRFSTQVPVDESKNITDYGDNIGGTPYRPWLDDGTNYIIRVTSNGEKAPDYSTNANSEKYRCDSLNEIGYCQLMEGNGDNLPYMEFRTSRSTPPIINDITGEYEYSPLPEDFYVTISDLDIFKVNLEE